MNIASLTLIQLSIATVDIRTLLLHHIVQSLQYNGYTVCNYVKITGTMYAGASGCDGCARHCVFTFRYAVYVYLIHYIFYSHIIN